MQRSHTAFFGICEPLRDFGRVHSMSQDMLFLWKSCWKSSLGESSSWVGGSQGISRAVRKILAMLTETWMWCLPAIFVGEGSLEITWHMPALMSGEKLPLQPLTQGQMIRFLHICPWNIFSYCPNTGTHNE